MHFIISDVLKGISTVVISIYTKAYLINLHSLNLFFLNPRNSYSSLENFCSFSNLAPLRRHKTTEYTELQPLLSGVHSVMRVKFALAGEGGGCMPTPFYYIYHHQ
jgi:hypothetical protein